MSKLNHLILICSVVALANLCSAAPEFGTFGSLKHGTLGGDPYGGIGMGIGGIGGGHHGGMLGVGEGYLPIWAIILIVIFSILFIGCLVAGIVYLLRKRQTTT